MYAGDWTVIASMGPRSVERGNGDIFITRNAGDDELQWGRVRSNAETRSRGVVFDMDPSLQWGRVRSNAETRRDRPRVHQQDGASMGPRSVERGNLHPVCQWGCRDRASMGPRSVERGNLALHDWLFDEMSASMGPRSVERGN